ncbi:hypothetical protein POTOM_009609 [Populus tomentosa]|uniref:Uncharacterized protein n=1 Tax=Populus tomentosa TaxID=118781 RepID=A0A8X8AC52_POPTO|nr:hypothetical protein POTOM_009609 [Populus tomentosa]
MPVTLQVTELSNNPTVCPSSFHFIFAITALRFPYTKLNSLLPSVSPPPLSSPSPLLTTFSATDAYENRRVAAATVPREYLPNISERNPRFYTGRNSAATGGKTGHPPNLSRKTYLLPPTRLPADFITDRVPITIIDTSASPWGEAPYKDAAERITKGNLTLDGLLSGVCSATTISLVPADSCNSCHSKRAVDRKKQQIERNVFHCLVFGPKNSGKSALSNSFLGRCCLEPIVIAIVAICSG